MRHVLESRLEPGLQQLLLSYARPFREVSSRPSRWHIGAGFPFDVMQEAAIIVNTFPRGCLALKAKLDGALFSPAR